MNEAYTRETTIKNGIEWISYIPHERKHATPILMQHGMWHGAWCWMWWQECFAEWGWESHAISLPGHGASPTQRPIRLCTLDYYLPFVREAIESFSAPPVLMGHSMGGALAQWYLRDVGNLPAAVLVAPWALYKGFLDCVGAFMALDPLGTLLLSNIGLRAELVRTSALAGKALLSQDSILSPEELHARLGHESLLVMVQHLRPWRRWDGLTTPILWLGAEKDAVVPEHAARRAAGIYATAEYRMIPGAAHNIMMEHNYRDIAQSIGDWLTARLENP